MKSVVENNADTKFGISRNAYAKAEAASSLQSIYDLNDENSEVAFYLSDRFNIPLKAAFKIVWSCIRSEET